MSPESAIHLVEIIVAVAVAMLLGDYLGYKIKRTRLAVILGCVVLITIVGFAIYYAIYAAVNL